MNETMKYHEQLQLTDEDVIAMYETMVLTRKLDVRMWLLNRAGKIPFVISGQGQEATQIGAAFALDKTKDYIAPYYRDMGIVLHFGMTPRELMLFAFAKADDPNSGGRQMPGHFGQRKNRILTVSSPVATQIPHAVGIALAGRLKGDEFVSFVSLGEGSTNQGDFHEGLNFAGVHQLPVITLVENNHYAISVPLEKQIGRARIVDRALGYGMHGERVNGQDPLAVYAVVKAAADRARRGEGPTLIEAMTHRFTPHSSDDDHRLYREADELEEMKQLDPIVQFAAYCVQNGVLTEEAIAAIDAKLDAVVDDATEFAEAAPYAIPEHALRFVYEEGADA